MSGHGDLLLRSNGIFSSPQAGDGLPLCVESEAVLAVEVCGTGAGNAGLVASEAEHGQGDGDGYIDTNLAGFKFFLEQRCCGAGLCEDCGSVAVRIGIDQVDGVLGGLNL